MMGKYTKDICDLISWGHPNTIEDLATLTRSTKQDVLLALDRLREYGIVVWSDGISAENRGYIHG